MEGQWEIGENGIFRKMHDYESGDDQLTAMAVATKTLVYDPDDGSDFWVVGVEIYSDEDTTARVLTLYDDSDGTTLNATTMRHNLFVYKLTEMLAGATTISPIVPIIPGRPWTNKVWAILSGLTGGNTLWIRIITRKRPSIDQ